MSPTDPPLPPDPDEPDPDGLDGVPDEPIEDSFDTDEPSWSGDDAVPEIAGEALGDESFGDRAFGGDTGEVGPSGWPGPDSEPDDAEVPGAITEELGAAMAAAPATQSLEEIESETAAHRRRVSQRRYAIRRGAVAVGALAVVGGVVGLLIALSGGGDDDDATGTEPSSLESESTVGAENPTTSAARPTTSAAGVATTSRPTTTGAAATETTAAAETTDAAETTEAPETTAVVETTDAPETTVVETTEAAETTVPETTELASTAGTSDTTEAATTETSEAPATTDATDDTTDGTTDGSTPESTLPEPPEYDLTIPAVCEMEIGVAVTHQNDSVACLEVRLAQIIVGPVPFDVDDLFDEDTDLAVRQFQEAQGLLVDGIVGPDTARALDIWPVPLGQIATTTTTAP